MGVDMILSASLHERDEEKTVAEILGKMLDNIEAHLHILGNTDAFYSWCHGEHGFPNEIIQPDLETRRRVCVGGAKCDCCGKKRGDVEGGLFRCTCCKKAYYCSETCQKTNWRAGHRHACRAPGKIEPGDYMLIKGLVNRSELNLCCGRIIRPVQGGRLEVKIEGRSKTLSIAPEKLSHLRPAK